MLNHYLKSNVIKFNYDKDFQLNLNKWPEFKIPNDTHSIMQRAYLKLNENKMQIDYNLRAEYCSFVNS